MPLKRRIQIYITDETESATIDLMLTEHNRERIEKGQRLNSMSAFLIELLQETTLYEKVQQKIKQLQST